MFFLAQYILNFITEQEFYHTKYVKTSVFTLKPYILVEQGLVLAFLHLIILTHFKIKADESEIKTYQWFTKKDVLNSDEINQYN